MPISLLPNNDRRAFLLTATLTGVAAATGTAFGKEDPWFALMADTHVDADPKKEARGVIMAENLERAVREILDEAKSSGLPEFSLINGDCAYLKGLKPDYETLRPRIQPLLDAGIPVHLTMGNHDDRGPFYDLFPEARNPDTDTAVGKHLTVIESQKANWFLIDTLQIVDNVTGELGEKQREWLAAELDKRSGKPAIIVGHHYPQYLPEGSDARVTGLADTVEFMDLLLSKPWVKAYVYGHSHNYGFKEASGGIHLINQPPVSYLFSEDRPNGWLKANLSGDGMAVTLRAFDAQHPENGAATNLPWKR
ncbi:MAG: metallophosphoesterase [Verrucomicrobiales bacterium]|nr:metallophosphoesterase [Verrucomicrobiales bacterium]